MCLVFLCSTCYVDTQQYCPRHLEYASYCDNVSDVSSIKRNICETCQMLRHVTRRLEQLAWVKPWRTTGAEKESWENSEPEQTFSDSDFECEGWEKGKQWGTEEQDENATDDWVTEGGDSWWSVEDSADAKKKDGNDGRPGGMDRVEEEGEDDEKGYDADCEGHKSSCARWHKSCSESQDEWKENVDRLEDLELLDRLDLFICQ